MASTSTSRDYAAAMTTASASAAAAADAVTRACHPDAPAMYVRRDRRRYIQQPAGRTNVAGFYRDDSDRYGRKVALRTLL